MKTRFKHEGHRFTEIKKLRHEEKEGFFLVTGKVDGMPFQGVYVERLDGKNNSPFLRRMFKKATAEFVSERQIEATRLGKLGLGYVPKGD